MKSIFFIFFFAQIGICQKTDTSFASKNYTDFGINLLITNYTFGVNEGSYKGSTNGISISTTLLNEDKSGIFLELGNFTTIQNGSRFCEYVGEVQGKFNESLKYISGLFFYKFKYFRLSIGFSLNNAKEQNTVCSNSFYFEPGLFSYGIEVGLMDDIYLEFGYKTDYSIHQNLKNNYGVYFVGLNYFFKEYSFINITYFGNKTNYLKGYEYVDEVFTGFLLDSKIFVINNFGIKSTIYFLDSKRKSLNIGVVYKL